MWIFLGLKWKLPFFRPNFVSSVSPLHLLEQQMTELRDDRASPHLCSRARSCPNNTRTPGCRRDFWAAKCNEIMTGCRGETLMCPRARATSVPAPPPHKLALVLLNRGKHCTTRPYSRANLSQSDYTPWQLPQWATFWVLNQIQRADTWKMRARKARAASPALLPTPLRNGPPAWNHEAESGVRLTACSLWRAAAFPGGG